MGTSMTKKRPAEQDGKTNGYRQILMEKRASALAGLGAQTHYLAQAERICEEDQALSSQEEAVSLCLNGHEYKQLRQIQEALDSMQLGEYGICLSCGEAIPAKRLQALPVEVGIATEIGKFILHQERTSSVFEDQTEWWAAYNSSREPKPQGP